MTSEIRCRIIFVKYLISNMAKYFTDQVQRMLQIVCWEGCMKLRFHSIFPKMRLQDFQHNYKIVRILQYGPLRWTTHELISPNSFYETLNKRKLVSISPADNFG